MLINIYIYIIYIYIYIVWPARVYRSDLSFGRLRRFMNRKQLYTIWQLINILILFFKMKKKCNNTFNTKLEAMVLYYTLFKGHIFQKLVWPCWCIGWFDTVSVSWLVSSVHFSCTVQYSLYHNMDVGTIWHCTLVSNTPSQSKGLVLGCALFWCWVSCMLVHFLEI